MPIYEYQHPLTNETFDLLLPLKKEDLPYSLENGEKVISANKDKCTLEDGTICERIWSRVGYCGLAAKEKEVWQVDPEYVKKCRPKFVMSRRGEKIPYDPTRHC